MRAYSIAVERLHGMEEVGVRFPVGPPLRPHCVKTSRGLRGASTFCYYKAKWCGVKF